MAMKQLIVVRQDLGMSRGKIAAQACHASIAFITRQLAADAAIGEDGRYHADLVLDPDVVDGWLRGSFTKIVCRAKNRRDLEKAIGYAGELGLEEDRDFFLIRDNCLTELEPEDPDGRTLTCIGFRPLEEDAMRMISKKYQLLV